MRPLDREHRVLEDLLAALKAGARFAAPQVNSGPFNDLCKAAMEMLHGIAMTKHGRPYLLDRQDPLHVPPPDQPVPTLAEFFDELDKK